MIVTIVSKSGDCHFDPRVPKRLIMRVARFWSARWQEPVTVYTSSLFKKDIYEEAYKGDLKGLDRDARKKATKVMRLRYQLNSAIKTFKKLPRRESFSGLHYASEIDRLQKELDKMGDKEERFRPEISIEIPPII